MGTATKGLALTVVAGTTAAAGVYTIVGPGVSNAETVTIGTRVFEFDTAVPPGSVVAGNVRVDVSGGAGEAAAATALIAAINADSGCLATAVTGGAGVVNVTAKEIGTGGNAIAKSTTAAAGDWDGVGAFLTGGTDTAIALQRGGSFNFNGDAIDVTTKDDPTFKSFLMGHVEGEITCDGLLDITDATQSILFDAMETERPLTVIFRLDAATNYFTAKCWVTSFKANGAHDGPQDYSATLKCTGIVARTP
jgi:predicted secreted protein